MDRLTNINIENYKITKEIIDSTPPEFVELHEKIKNNILKRLELKTKTFENELRKIKWLDVDKLKEKLSKLAEYENTNLTPQEVLELQNENEELLRFLEENNLYGARDATEYQLRDFLWKGK